MDNSKWSYTDQLGLKEKQKLQKNYQVVQQKWIRRCTNSRKKYGQTKYEFITWQIRNSSIVAKLHRGQKKLKNPFI
jgi:hypothetical protein